LLRGMRTRGSSRSAAKTDAVNPSFSAKIPQNLNFIEVFLCPFLSEQSSSTKKA
jgi:hypothetical protein